MPDHRGRPRCRVGEKRAAPRRRVGEKRNRKTDKRTTFVKRSKGEEGKGVDAAAEPSPLVAAEFGGVRRMTAAEEAAWREDGCRGRGWLPRRVKGNAAEESDDTLDAPTLPLRGEEQLAAIKEEPSSSDEEPPGIGMAEPPAEAF